MPLRLQERRRQVVLVEYPVWVILIPRRAVCGKW